MRIGTLVAVAAAVLLAPADVADAKGPTEVTIEATWLTRPLRVEVAQFGYVPDDPFWELAEEVHAMYPVASTRPWSIWARSPAEGLGPRLHLTWRMTYQENGALHEVLYPWADGGPLVHTPPGQRFLGSSARAGWHAADSAVLATLRDLGIIAGSAERW